MGNPKINVLLALMIIASFLVATVLHGWAQSLTASWLGDATPQAEGRQTLSLRPHLDALGTLMCVILAFQPTPAIQLGLGWGKPVKPDPWKLRMGPDMGVLAVAASGMIFNLLVGLLMALILHFVYPILVVNAVTMYVFLFLLVFASVNICLALLNLIPVYPLDGYHILYSLLPSKQAVQFAKSASYGPFILLGYFFLLPFLFSVVGLQGFILLRLGEGFYRLSLLLIGLVSGLSPYSPTLYSLHTLHLFAFIGF
ncbi:site-2 protease family protein [Ktedonosporobacter rubrisoli]|uniref:Site-2 protease family protein n=1 Tax=Ktedonosporobacter rubrisoli TaxID=2509675 RepID=A0A4P6JWI6_KTERU|nr:site-2 protease family protein [Ktedonosporobacter rubrisoli]QBD80059.1 site-2 protease family protein [Ktedonosporobacter rubrisoli]